jgi:hypothetical protein
LPDSEAIIPSRILSWSAHQLAEEPESEAVMQRSGSHGLNSQKTRCGLIGSASFMARPSTTCHQRAMLCSISSRHDRSALRSK